jgi:hypothetical protein
MYYYLNLYFAVANKVSVATKFIWFIKNAINLNIITTKNSYFITIIATIVLFIFYYFNNGLNFIIIVIIRIFTIFILNVLLFVTICFLNGHY